MLPLRQVRVLRGPPVVYACVRPAGRDWLGGI
jgi:hypothetical protein